MMKKKLKDMIKEFDDEDWISIESLREIDNEELMEILHNA